MIQLGEESSEKEETLGDRPREEGQILNTRGLTWQNISPLDVQHMSCIWKHLWRQQRPLKPTGVRTWWGERNDRSVSNSVTRSM